jgi:hypothetical protein
MALLLCMLFLQVAGVVSSGRPTPEEGVGTDTTVSTATIRKPWRRWESILPFRMMGFSQETCAAKN